MPQGGRPAPTHTAACPLAWLGPGGIRRLGITHPDALKAPTVQRIQFCVPGEPASPWGYLRAPRPHLQMNGHSQAIVWAARSSGPTTVPPPVPTDTGSQGRGLTQVAEAAVEPWITEAGPVEAVAPATVSTVALLVALLPVEALGAACERQGLLSAHLDMSPCPWRCSKHPPC